MAYSELIKNFNKIRFVMRDFYVYGFKRRGEVTNSSRSYDDVRRRLEDWLGEDMSFRYDGEGKTVFFSIDSRRIPVNPFFKALRAKSFTDGDLCLHMYIFSLLASPSDRLTVTQMLRAITNLEEEFPGAPLFDESTLRKKLKEYCGLGVLKCEKQGNKLLYSRAEDVPLPSPDALGFASELFPCGALASFLCDETPPAVRYKHHYIETALESEVLFSLFEAIGEEREVELSFQKSREPFVPLAIYIGTRTGRRYAVGMSRQGLAGKRIDRIFGVKKGEVCPAFQSYREKLNEARSHLWGASFGRRGRTGKVRFRIRIEAGEEYVLRRLEREKRCGTVTMLDAQTAEFCADVYDATELVPWIRTFLGRIVSLDFDDRTAENQLKEDFIATCRMYGIGEDV